MNIDLEVADKCPFCGKKQEGTYKNQFVCETYWAKFAKEYIQSQLCMKFQIAQQSEIIREARCWIGVLKQIRIDTKLDTAFPKGTDELNTLEAKMKALEKKP